MNADPDFDALKNTLRKFSPSPLPDDLRRTLEIAASHVPSRAPQPLPFADRLLALWTATGALAAALVLALTVWQVTTTPRLVPTSPQNLAAQQQSMQELQTLLASR